ncbi:MAG TPA: hypothetical protein VJ180_10775 [Pyrinomonadaceae bacterium]|nr:hypothetical protein [Pyrinomonadaceae bacterium]
MLASLLSVSVPPAVAQATLKEAAARSSDVASRVESTVKSWLDVLNLRRKSGASQEQNRGMPSLPVNPPSVRPQAPPSKTRVVSIRTNMSDEVILRSREPMMFSAVPVDSQEATINGLKARWQSSNKQVLFIGASGEAMAAKPGTAVATASAGQARKNIQVRVIEGSSEPFGGKKGESAIASDEKIRGNGLLDKTASAKRSPAKRHHGAGKTARPGGTQLTVSSTKPLSPMLPIRPPNEDPLPDNETSSLYLPANNVGSPPGTKRPGGITPACAGDGTETGNKNFTFALPVTSLPGRGISVSLSLVHNSLLYNKSTSGGSTMLTYDVDSGYPAPGFRLGFGQIEDQGSSGFTLTDPDGTRHALVYDDECNL